MSRIQHSIENGYQVDMGDCLSKAWTTFKDTAGFAIGFLLLTIIISMIMSAIPTVGSQISNFILSPPLALGYIILAKRHTTGEGLEFGNMFDGFKKIVPLILTNLILMAGFLLLFAPVFAKIGFSFLQATSPDDILEVADELQKVGPIIFLSAILAIFIFILFRWAPYLIQFKDYNPIEALKTSFQLTSKNIGAQLLYIVLAMALMIAGVLALFVGVLVAIPLVSMLDFHIFDSAVALEDGDNNDDDFLRNDDFL